MWCDDKAYHFGFYTDIACRILETHGNRKSITVPYGKCVAMEDNWVIVTKNATNSKTFLDFI